MIRGESMKQIFCSNCHHDIILNDSTQEIVFCNYCGNKINLAEGTIQEEIQLENEIAALLNDKDPVRIHRQLTELHSKYPKSLAVNRALLMQGRLHERNPKKLDYSVIHCYLLNLFLEPNAFDEAQKNSILNELSEGPNLLACLDLVQDKNLFLQNYYVDLSKRFIELFLLGSSKHMRHFFGLATSRNPAKMLALPASTMIQNMLECTILGERRFVLAKAFYTAFGTMFESLIYLDEALQESKNLVKAEYRKLNL